MRTPSIARPTMSFTMALGAAVLLAGCSAQDSPAAPPADVDPTLEHIHELVADPVDGSLLVATHSGLFRLKIGTDGAATAVGPIGGLDFDPMGFTIVDGIAYASGHPGPTTPDTFGSPNLGLITSTDLGENWTNVSLMGETDFHGLTVATSPGASPRVFGYDGSKQRIVSSLDGGVSWNDGAQISARDILAVGDLLYATTADGLVVSADNGATFTVDTAAPALFVIAADHNGAIAGIDVAGIVWTRQSDDSWVSGGAVTGAPHAFAINGSRFYVADDRGIAYTDDAGVTWVVLKLKQ